MKKNKMIIIVAIVLVIVIGIATLLICKNSEESKDSLLLVSSNYDMKYGASFGGTAIFNDGSIYTWYYSSTKSEYNNYVGSYSINTKDGFKEFIMDKAKKKEEKISSKDLSKIKKIIKKIKEEDIKLNCNANEIKYSELVIYKKDEIFRLNISEDCSSSNESINELLSIINNYKKKK